jgi:hypothetical protein
VLVRRKVGGASVRGRAPWPQSRPPVRRVRVCAGRKPSRWPGVHDWGTTLDSAAACSACSGPFKLRRTIGDRVYSPVAARGSIGFETSRLLTRSRRVTWWARANAASTAAKRPPASFVSSCSRSAPPARECPPHQGRDGVSVSGSPYLGLRCQTSRRRQLIRRDLKAACYAAAMFTPSCSHELATSETVARCMSRFQRRSSKSVPRCMVQRLSQITRSRTRQRCV